MSKHVNIQTNNPPMDIAYSTWKSNTGVKAYLGQLKFLLIIITVTEANRAILLIDTLA